MAENLAYKASSGCWAYNDSVPNVVKYGYLFNLETAKTVCPKGWYLPNDADWETLITYLGGEDVAGGKLKETGTTHWTSPNTGATNESGFTALPGGGRGYDGTFDDIGGQGYWWSSTESSTDGTGFKIMYCTGSHVNSNNTNMKSSGFSVRCIRGL